MMNWKWLIFLESQKMMICSRNKPFSMPSHDEGWSHCSKFLNETSILKGNNSTEILWKLTLPILWQVVPIGIIVLEGLPVLTYLCFEEYCRYLSELLHYHNRIPLTLEWRNDSADCLWRQEMLLSVFFLLSPGNLAVLFSCLEVYCPNIFFIWYNSIRKRVVNVLSWKLFFCRCCW